MPAVKDKIVRFAGLTEHVCLGRIQNRAFLKKQAEKAGENPR